METSTGSKLGRQGVDESTEPNFDGQQVRNNMDIDNNDYFEEFEENISSGDRQSQNQKVDQLVLTGAAGQTARQTA